MANSAVRVKIKSSAYTAEKLNEFLKLCSNHELKVTKIYAANNAYNVTFPTLSDADGLFRYDTLQSLTKSNFDPIMPPQIKANLSVLIKKCDPIIFENTCDDIRSEIEERNKWSKVREVIKIGNSKILKIVFETSSICKRCLCDGLFMFSLFVPSIAIVKDEYCELLTCFRCYAVDKHQTSDCPMDPTTVICSNCASTDHKWTQCRSISRKCVNCDGDHHSMSSACLIRKDLLQKKRKAQKPTYSQSYASTSKPNPDLLPNIALVNPDHLLKSYTCIMLAVFGAGKSTSFGDTLNNLLKQNNLPVIKCEGYQPLNFEKLILGENGSMEKNRKTLTKSHEIANDSLEMEEIQECYSPSNRDKTKFFMTANQLKYSAKKGPSLSINTSQKDIKGSQLQVSSPMVNYSLTDCNLIPSEASLPSPIDQIQTRLRADARKIPKPSCSQATKNPALTTEHKTSKTKATKNFGK